MLAPINTFGTVSQRNYQASWLRRSQSACLFTLKVYFSTRAAFSVYTASLMHADDCSRPSTCSVPNRSGDTFIPQSCAAPLSSSRPSLGFPCMRRVTRQASSSGDRSGWFRCSVRRTASSANW